MTHAEKVRALNIIGPIILSRVGGTHSLVLKTLGIPREEWPQVRAQYDTPDAGQA